MNEREHTVVLRKSPNETVLDAKCGECDYVLKTPDDYHPEAFCILRKAGHDPIQVVGLARQRVPEQKVVAIRRESEGA